MPLGSAFDRRRPRAILSSAVLSLYLAALIFGLGASAVQLMSSSTADSAGHPALPADVGDAAPSELVQAGHAAAGGWASIFGSLRFYMFAAIAFGAVGAPVTAFGSVAPALTCGVALLTALAVGIAASFGFRLLGRDTSGGGAKEADLLGKVGRVLIACEKGRRGKVRLTVRGQLLDVVATTDELRLGPGAGVIVQEVHAERVHVCAAPSELLPE